MTLVGKIVSVAEKQLQLMLQIDDGTGVVDVKYWIEEAETVRLCRPTP